MMTSNERMQDPARSRRALMIGVLVVMLAAAAAFGFMRFGPNMGGKTKIDETPQRLLPEPPGGSIVWSSLYLNDGKWFKPEGASIAEAAVVSPEGRNAALTLVEGRSQGLHRVETAIPGVTPGKAYVFSVHVKPAGRTKLRLELRDAKLSRYGVATFDLARTRVLATTGDVQEAGCRPSEAGWLRCWGRIAPAGEVIVATLTLVTNEDAHSYPGDGESGIHAWGAQVTQGAELFRLGTDDPSRR